MNISRERLIDGATRTGYRPDVLEKVARLLGLLEGFRSHPFLKSRFALKGGTALNLFVFDVPRLSVDIELNYIGPVDRDQMLVERPRVEQAVTAVCQRERFSLRKVPADHAGGKWRPRHQSAFGTGGNLEIDLNYMFRVPLWQPVAIDSKVIGELVCDERAHRGPARACGGQAGGRAGTTSQPRPVRCTKPEVLCAERTHPIETAMQGSCRAGSRVR